MPIARETTINTPLSGAELKSLIREDFDRLVDSEGLLNDYVAYGRVAYRLSIQLQVDRPVQPEAAHVESRTVAADLIARVPAFRAVQSPPIRAGSPDMVTAGTTLFRKITSPNAERLRTGTPVPVLVREQDGTRHQEMVRYPKPDDAGDGDVTVEDSSAEARARWGV